MKRTDITYQDKLNELMLDIPHPNSKGINFIFVEGDSDIKLFRKLFDLEKCKVEYIPGGNAKLEECVSILSEKSSLVIGIRDADFMYLDDEPYLKTNMFLTDCHDIEMTMLNQELVLNSLLFEFTDYSKENHLTFRNDIMKSIELMSYLKWLNILEELEFNFSFGFQDLVSFEDFSIDFSEYLKRIFSKSGNAQIKDNVIIREKISNLMTLEPNMMQLTNGHDLLNTFAKYFRERTGHKGLRGEDIARALRMVFTFEHFQDTKLYEALKKWSLDNDSSIFLATPNS